MNHTEVTAFIDENPRCLLTAKALFGDMVTHEIRPVEVRQYGYNCKSGGWALYNTEMSDTPAYFLGYKRKARRKISSINIKDIERLEPLT